MEKFISDLKEFQQIELNTRSPSSFCLVYKTMLSFSHIIVTFSHPRTCYMLWFVTQCRGSSSDLLVTSVTWHGWLPFLLKVLSCEAALSSLDKVSILSVLQFYSVKFCIYNSNFLRPHQSTVMNANTSTRIVQMSQIICSLTVGLTQSLP